MSECGEPTAQCAYLSIGPVILRVVGCLQLHHAVQGASLCCLCSKDSRRWIHGRSAADAAQIVLGSAQNESPSALDRCSTRSDEGCRRYSHNVLLFKRDAASQARCGDVIGRARHEPAHRRAQRSHALRMDPAARAGLKGPAVVSAIEQKACFQERHKLCCRESAKVRPGSLESRGSQEAARASGGIRRDRQHRRKAAQGSDRLGPPPARRERRPGAGRSL